MNFGKYLLLPIKILDFLFKNKKNPNRSLTPHDPQNPSADNQKFITYHGVLAQLLGLIMLFLLSGLITSWGYQKFGLKYRNQIFWLLWAALIISVVLWLVCFFLSNDYLQLTLLGLVLTSGGFLLGTDEIWITWEAIEISYSNPFWFLILTIMMTTAAIGLITYLFHHQKIFLTNQFSNNFFQFLIVYYLGIIFFNFDSVDISWWLVLIFLLWKLLSLMVGVIIWVFSWQNLNFFVAEKLEQKHTAVIVGLLFVGFSHIFVAILQILELLNKVLLYWLQ